MGLNNAFHTSTGVECEVFYITLDRLNCKFFQIFTAHLHTFLIKSSKVMTKSRCNATKILSNWSSFSFPSKTYCSFKHPSIIFHIVRFSSIRLSIDWISFAWPCNTVLQQEFLTTMKLCPSTCSWPMTSPHSELLAHLSKLILLIL